MVVSEDSVDYEITVLHNDLFDSEVVRSFSLLDFAEIISNPVSTMAPKIMAIERCFEILRAHFPILKRMVLYSLQTQVLIMVTLYN